MNGGAWDKWVDDWSRQTYRKEKTRLRYQSAWTAVRYWLRMERIGTPTMVKREDVYRYAEWRGGEKKGDQSKPRRHPSNLAASPTVVALECKVWAAVMDEAVERGFALRNPCRKLHLSDKPLKQKPEIKPEEEDLIRAELQAGPEWMLVSFNIAMAQGVRLRETSWDLRKDVDLKRGVVTIYGKGEKVFTTKLNPDLHPMLEAFVREGRERTCEFPKSPSARWAEFFRRIGLPHLCFHCTRVSAITRAARAGVSRGQALRFFNHASNAVHDVYTRLEVEDTEEVIAALRTGRDLGW